MKKASVILCVNLLATLFFASSSMADADVKRAPNPYTPLDTSPATSFEDPDGFNTGLYYFKGKVHECLSIHSMPLMPDGNSENTEKNEAELFHLTSRLTLLEDAYKDIAAAKPKWLKQTLNSWLLRSARYEEGRNSIRVMEQKDSFLILDECQSLVPYLEKNILKRSLMSQPAKDDGDEPMWTDWRDIK